ncbi:HipA-like C-terminal domain-containing protein [Salegentibacter flavus]|uniref:HipA-like C-terminal domain-containing protein n=2 Tax=Flavobacteriaceae TaxID=49546 RepID=A0A1I5CKE4_9FLAO|nr:HipA-like C-terminal domain-containing protein [Salegentibacter flavus]
MEDACQFTERLTEHKYRGSYEQIAKGIITYAQNPILEVVRFYQQVIVSFLIGNNDMHLKNFSLIAFNNDQYHLARAYDMIAAKLLMPEDSEELALKLNEKKRKLKRNDFNEAMSKACIPDKAIKNLWNRIQ